MERSYTYEKPSNLFDTSSPMESISCKYVGPENILIVVDENGKFSIEEVPVATDGVYSSLNLDGIPEDLSTEEGDSRYVILDANNDNHVPLMQLIAGEEINVKETVLQETIGTFTHSDGSTFTLKYEEDDSNDPVGTIDEEATLISDDNTINYVYAFTSVNDDVLMDSVDQNIETSRQKKVEAETVALKKLWAKHIEVLEWVKSDIIGNVDPWKVVVPTVVDVELGANFEDRDL